jgi:osmotically inducible lipoprotein OsmB
MKKYVTFATLAAALALGGCYTPEQRAVGGAALGGATGAAIGGIASGTAGGAVAGGLIGAAGGAIIGAATAPPPPRRCYWSRYYQRTVCRY